MHEILPTLDSHLLKLGVELEALTFQWFLSIFTDCLAAEALFRVWDVILCLVGSPFLFQVALALLKLNEKALLNCNSAAGVYSYLNGEMTHQGISIDGLIRESDGMRGMVRKVDVERRREQAVKRELADMAVGEEEEEAARLEASLAVEAPAAATKVTVVVAPEAVSEGEETAEEVTEAGSNEQKPASATPAMDTAEGMADEISGMSGCVPEDNILEKLTEDARTNIEVQETSAPEALSIVADKEIDGVVETDHSIPEETALETEPLAESAGFEKATLGRLELEVSLSTVTEDGQELASSPPTVTVISVV